MDEKFRGQIVDFPEEKGIHGLLLKLIHRYFNTNYKKFSDLGVHPGQIPILRMLHQRQGTSQRELADMLHIKPPTVNVTVKRLEKAELVYREADKEDQRVSRIYLTKKGHDITRKIIALLEENDRILESGFTEGEICLTKRFLQQMIENMENIETVDGEGKIR